MMRKKRFLLTAIACCLFLQAIAQDAKLSLFYKELTNFLQAEGFNPTSKENNAGIVFVHNGENHSVKTIYDGQLYFVVFNKIGYIIGGENGLLSSTALFAGNDINANTKAVKIYCSDNRVVFNIQQYTRSVDNFKNVFFENLEILTKADEQFIAKYRNLQDNEVGAKSAVTYLSIKQSYTSPIASGGGSKTYTVSTDGGSYEILDLPSWCHAENKEASSFRLVCASNDGAARSHLIRVRSNGMERQMEITQNGNTVQQSTRTLPETSGTAQTQTFIPKVFNRYSRSHGLTVGVFGKEWNVGSSGDYVDGFRLGYVYLSPFGSGFSLRTGLNLDIANGDYFSETAINLPIHTEYRLHFSKKSSLFFETGISVEYAFVNYASVNYASVNDYYDPSNHFNAYWDFEGGFRFKKFQISTGISSGLTPVTFRGGYYNQDKEATSLGWLLGVSYFF